jgi:TPR repeat protein
MCGSDVFGRIGARAGSRRTAPFRVLAIQLGEEMAFSDDLPRLVDVLTGAETRPFGETVRYLQARRKQAGGYRFLEDLADAYLRYDGVHPGTDFEKWQSVGMSEDLVDGLMNLGITLWDLEDTRPAIRCLREAVEGGSEAAILVLASSYLWEEKYEESFRLARTYRVGTSDADDLDISSTLGQASLHLHGLTDQNRRWLKAAAEKDPAALAALVDALIEAEELVDAENVLRRAAEAGSVAAPIMLGNLYQDHLASPDRAASAYRLGIARGDAFSAYNLGLLLEIQGQHEEAAQWIGFAAVRGDELAAAWIANRGNRQSSEAAEV